MVPTGKLGLYQTSPLLLEIKFPGRFWADEWVTWYVIFLRAHPGCHVENKLVVGCWGNGWSRQNSGREQWYWSRVIVVSMVRSRWILDTSEIKPVEFLMVWNCSVRERGESRLVPGFLVSATRRMDSSLVEPEETMAGERLWMELVWWILNAYIWYINSFNLPRWQMHCSWDFHKIEFTF